MSNPKVSINADITLDVMARFTEPQKLKTIASGTGNAEIKQLEKYQVRSAVEDYLIPADLVERYKKEEKGNEVHYFVLTKAGRARAESEENHQAEIQQLQSEIEQLKETQEALLPVVNEKMPRAVERIKEDVELLSKETQIELIHCVPTDD